MDWSRAPSRYPSAAWHYPFLFTIASGQSRAVCRISARKTACCWKFPCASSSQAIATFLAVTFCLLTDPLWFEGLLSLVACLIPWSVRVAVWNWLLKAGAIWFYCSLTIPPFWLSSYDFSIYSSYCRTILKHIAPHLRAHICCSTLEDFQLLLQPLLAYTPFAFPPVLSSAQTDSSSCWLPQSAVTFDRYSPLAFLIPLSMNPCLNCSP